MFNFETYIQLYEMGEAYKRITKEMGPSPQLIAFVNYEKIVKGVALESFDIETDHNLILEEIDNSDNLKFAIESLSNIFSKLKSKLKKPPLKKEVLISEEDTYDFKVISYQDYPKCKKACFDIIKYTEDFLKHLPKSTNFNSWSELYSTDSLKHDYDKVNNLFGTDCIDPDKVLFDKSGWTLDKCKKELNDYKILNKKMNDLDNEMVNILDNFDNVLEMFENVKVDKSQEILKGLKNLNEITNFLKYVLEIKRMLHSTIHYGLDEIAALHFDLPGLGSLFSE